MILTIRIEIPEGKYKFLVKTIKNFKADIYKWQLEKFMSKKLMCDLSIMQTILETCKTEVKTDEQKVGPEVSLNKT